MSKLKLIHCGVGGFGANWVRNHSSQSPDFDIVALVDISESVLHSAGTDIGLSQDRLFTDLAKAVKAVDADAVLTVTPPAVHLKHARIAFRNGLHLMTEKPIADTMGHAVKMADLAKEAGKVLFVSQNYRFNPSMQTLKKLLAEKTCGEFGHGHLDFYIPADFTGSFRETMDFPLLVDMAIHHFDLIREVTGLNIESIYVRGFRPDWSWYQHEPAFKAILTLEGGIPFSYSGDWSAKGRTTSWNGDWRLQCRDGSIHNLQDGVHVGRCEKWSKEPQWETIPTVPVERTAQTATLHLFAEAIRSGHAPILSGEDNLQSFGAVCAGVLSAQKKKEIHVAEFIERHRRKR